MQYNAKVKILRIARTSDGMGGWDEALNVLHNNLPCRITFKRGSEKIFFDKTTHYSDARLFCRIIDVTVKDRIEHNGDIFEIVDKTNPDNKNRYLSMDIKRNE